VSHYYLDDASGDLIRIELYDSGAHAALLPSSPPNRWQGLAREPLDLEAGYAFAPSTESPSAFANGGR
jgi:hypothetical protein